MKTDVRMYHYQYNIQWATMNLANIEGRWDYHDHQMNNVRVTEPLREPVIVDKPGDTSVRTINNNILLIYQWPADVFSALTLASKKNCQC